MVSADAVEVRNDLQGGPHPKAIENKKTEYMLSEILVPVDGNVSSYALVSKQKIKHKSIQKGSFLYQVFVV